MDPDVRDFQILKQLVLLFWFYFTIQLMLKGLILTVLFFIDYTH